MSETQVINEPQVTTQNERGEKGIDELDSTLINNAFFEANEKKTEVTPIKQEPKEDTKPTETITVEPEEEEPEAAEAGKEAGKETGKEAGKETEKLKEETPKPETSVDWKAIAEQREKDIQTLKGNTGNKIKVLKQELDALKETVSNKTSTKHVEMTNEAKQRLRDSGYSDEAIADLETISIANLDAYFAKKEKEMEEANKRKEESNSFKAKYDNALSYVHSQVIANKQDSKEISKLIDEEAFGNPDFYLTEIENEFGEKEHTFKSAEAIKHCYNKVCKDLKEKQTIKELQETIEQLKKKDSELKDLKDVKKRKAQIPIDTGKETTIKTETGFAPLSADDLRDSWQEVNKK